MLLSSVGVLAMAAAGANVIPELSQKPNQKCIKCNKKIVNGVKCSLCSALLHYRCANLEENKPVSDYKCDFCESPDTAFFDAIEDFGSTKVDTKIFVYIIKQKDALINELRDKIDLLNKYINLINEQQTDISKDIHDDKKQDQSKTGCTQKITQKTKAAAINSKTTLDTKKHDNDNPSNIHKKGNHIITKNDVSTGLMQEEARIKLNNYIHINDDIQEESGTNSNLTIPNVTGWKQIENKENIENSLSQAKIHLPVV